MEYTTEHPATHLLAFTAQPGLREFMNHDPLARCFNPFFTILPGNTSQRCPITMIRPHDVVIMKKASLFLKMIKQATAEKACYLPYSGLQQARVGNCLPPTADLLAKAGQKHCLKSCGWARALGAPPGASAASWQKGPACQETRAFAGIHVVPGPTGVVNAKLGVSCTKNWTEDFGGIGVWRCITGTSDNRMMR